MSPPEVFAAVVEAWKAEDRDRMLELAQPSWIEGVKSGPRASLRKLNEWIYLRGDQTLPDGTNPKERRRQLRSAMRAGILGDPAVQLDPLLDKKLISVGKPTVHEIDGLNPARMIDVKAPAVFEGGVERTLNIRMVYEDRWTWNPVSARRTE